MFIGEFIHAIDQKGRLQVPKKFRPDLSDGAVVSRGLDGCLFLHPKKRWEEFEEELVELPLTKSDARAFARHMFAGAQDVEIDSVGRILVPPTLRQYGGFMGDAVVIGVGKRVEIWAKDRWEKYRAQLESDSEAVAERLAELGL